MERVCKKCGATFESETKNTVCWDCKRANKRRIDALYRSTRRCKKERKKSNGIGEFMAKYAQYIKENGYISYGKYVVLTEREKSGKIK